MLEIQVITVFTLKMHRINEIDIKFNLNLKNILPHNCCARSRWPWCPPPFGTALDVV